jgi:hypothetical protein
VLYVSRNRSAAFLTREHFAYPKPHFCTPYCQLSRDGSSSCSCQLRISLAGPHIYTQRHLPPLLSPRAPPKCQAPRLLIHPHAPPSQVCSSVQHTWHGTARHGRMGAWAHLALLGARLDSLLLLHHLHLLRRLLLLLPPAVFFAGEPAASRDSALKGLKGRNRYPIGRAAFSAVVRGPRRAFARLRRACAWLRRTVVPHRSGRL